MPLSCQPEIHKGHKKVELKHRARKGFTRTELTANLLRLKLRFHICGMRIRQKLEKHANTWCFHRSECECEHEIECGKWIDPWTDQCGCKCHRINRELWRPDTTCEQNRHLPFHIPHTAYPIPHTAYRISRVWNLSFKGPALHCNCLYSGFLIGIRLQCVLERRETTHGLRTVKKSCPNRSAYKSHVVTEECT